MDLATTDYKVDDEVRVFAVGVMLNRDAPVDGWPGRIVKITPKQVHIEYGDRPLLDIFDRKSQRLRCSEVARRFRTLPQVAFDNRWAAAMAPLRDAGIQLSRDREYAIEQIEALAELEAERRFKAQG
jgi:hypothetical protein